MLGGYEDVDFNVFDELDSDEYEELMMDLDEGVQMPRERTSDGLGYSFGGDDSDFMEVSPPTSRATRTSRRRNNDASGSANGRQMNIRTRSMRQPRSTTSAPSVRPTTRSSSSTQRSGSTARTQRSNNRR